MDSLFYQQRFRNQLTNHSSELWPLVWPQSLISNVKRTEMKGEIEMVYAKRTLSFVVVGFVFIGLGFFLVIAPKAVADLAISSVLLISMGITHLLFGVTLLMFAQVYRSMRNFQRELSGQSKVQNST